MMLAVAIAEGAYEDVDLAVRKFQKATMAVKYARVPVVAAPFNMTLGGGCEFCLHADAIDAHAETYMGLVEIGVGLLPAGGGTKEMALRAIRLGQAYQTDVSPFIFKNFQNIGMAKVSTSADEAFTSRLPARGDSVTLSADRLIADAKQKVLALARNYRPAAPAQNLPAPGRSIAASIRSQLWNLAQGGQVTEYEATMAGVIAGVDHRRRRPGRDLDLRGIPAGAGARRFSQALRQQADRRTHPAHAEERQAAAQLTGMMM